MKLLTVFLRGGPIEVELADQECARVLNLMRSPLGKEINCQCANGDEFSFLAGHIDGHKVATVQPVKTPDFFEIDKEDAEKLRAAKIGETVHIKAPLPAGVIEANNAARKPNDRTKR